ncbi:hypothetical protein Patl1_17191 [Pistacia atlantica]|uniref:Uncharacterized protein n=1 Tax=Pistacia atlantica TaxID=434234 RepID=A0ACC1B720_9ROSI|nr:hypothetical protein Patl1_17191 [Pistacia atlantica]
MESLLESVPTQSLLQWLDITGMSSLCAKFTMILCGETFDGDGMVHGVRIKDGRATYASRFVKTSRLKQEEFFGGAKFGKPLCGFLEAVPGMKQVLIDHFGLEWGLLAALCKSFRFRF